MMNNARWIYNARGAHTYIVMGRWGRLSRSMPFLSGMRAAAEWLAINTQRLWPFKPLCTDARIVGVLQTINDALGGVRDAFLLYTGHYKQTICVGAVTDNDGNNHFIKAYKSSDDAALSVRQSAFVADHFGMMFQTITAHAISPTIIAYPLVDHRGAPSRNRLQSYVFDQCDQLFKLHGKDQKSVSSFMMLDMPLLFKRHNAIKIWKRARDFYDKSGLIVPITPVHGDMTLWNVMQRADGAFTLVDYERCGWHVGFYDVFHLHTQTHGLKGRTVYPDKIMKRINASTQHSVTDIAGWYIVYLLDQLRLDLGVVYDDGHQSARHNRLITTKISLLDKALKEFQA